MPKKKRNIKKLRKKPANLSVSKKKSFFNFFSHNLDIKNYLAKLTLR